MFEQYTKKFLEENSVEKIGHCSKCLQQGWSDSYKLKELYRYNLGSESVLVCKDHVGCYEIAKDLVKNQKPLNDLEKMRKKKELNNLINEGKKIVGR